MRPACFFQCLEVAGFLWFIVFLPFAVLSAVLLSAVQPLPSAVVAIKTT
jgi:hypothetical protein